MSKKKNSKDPYENIFPEEKLKELESLVEEMMKAASDVVEEYKDDEDIGEAISEMSSSLGQISGSNVIQIHENSPFLEELWKGDAWKNIIKAGEYWGNHTPPETEEDEIEEEENNQNDTE